MEQVFVDKMTEGTRKLGIVLSEKQMEQFYRYYELLVEWNKVMNLTGITELEEVVSKHFIDSVADVIRFELTGADADRSLVVIDKIAKTAKKYPRKAGVPSKEPIGK